MNRLAQINSTKVVSHYPFYFLESWYLKMVQNLQFLTELLRNKLYALDRKWKMLAYLLLGLACIGSVVALFFPNYKALIVYSLYSIISNFVIPVIPHEPIIMLYGTLYSPWLIAFCGSLSVCWVEFFNYLLLKSAMRLKPLRAVQGMNSYQKLERYFKKSPFFTLVWVCGTPVPLAPFRVLSVTSCYPVSKYLLSIFMGRFPRYYLLARLGATIQLPIWTYGIPIVIILAIALIRRKRSC